MKLHKTQIPVAKSRTRFRVLCCGRRWGKTTLAVEEIKGKALYKASRISYIAPTYQQARDIAWQMLKAELKPIIKVVNESRLELIVYTKDGEESIIQLRGWESIETLRGQKFDLLVIDEIASMRNFWANWEEVIRPTLTDTKGEAMFISTPKGFNHFYELYNKEKDDDDFESFHFTSYDNPYLPKEELDKAQAEIPEDRFAQEYLADFRKTEGLVYKEFNRKIHCYKELPEHVQFKEILCGVDFGWNNPAAVIKIGVDNDNNYYIDDEWYHSKKTTDEIIEQVQYLKPNAVYPDPAEPDRIEEMRRKAVNVRDVSKGKGSIENGINKIQDLLKTGRLRINEKCVNTIWELETYSYPEKRPDNNEPEIPIKENDHAMDAIRYALMMHQPTNPMLEWMQQQEILNHREKKVSFK